MPRPCHPLHDLLPLGGGCHWCDTYHANESYRNAWDEPPPPPGPGTHLKAILVELGVTPEGGCGCDDRAAMMDRWGPAGCRERRDEIAAWLAEQGGRLGWLAKLRVGLRGYWSAAALVDEAIRRSEQ